MNTTKYQCLEHLVLDSVLDSRFCVFRKGSIMFSVAHTKKLCFPSVRVGNDSNEITTECVRYITQVCLTKQNVSRIIFMPISYHMYNNSQFFFFMKMLNWRFSLCDLLALVRSKDSLHLHFHQSFLSLYVGLKHKMHKWNTKWTNTNTKGTNTNYKIHKFWRNQKIPFICISIKVFSLFTLGCM